MENLKIAIVGAGGSFTVGLIHDLCEISGLEGCTVALMDIDPQRLENSYEICKRHARERGFSLNFEKTLEREEALNGAQFVINTALGNGPRSLQDGWEIARKHGIEFGGSYHILYDEPFWLNFYQLRLFESLTQDMLRICPDAWHLMVANPVLAATTYLARKYPASKFVGLCHGFGQVYQIADILGLDRQGLTYEIPGVNHFVWLTHLYHDGEDVFPRIHRWIEEESEKHWQESTEDVFSPKRIDLFRKFGALPIGDTANWTGASWPWWYHSDTEVEALWKTDSEKGWRAYVSHLSGGAERIEKIAADTSRTIMDSYSLRPGLSGEPMVPIIESIALDIPRVIITNVQNTHEFVPGIPRDFEVEIPTLVSKRGVQGIATRGLPRPILSHILRDRVAPVEMELAAYDEGSLEYLVQLVLMDRWTSSEKAARELIQEVFELPYHVELRAHYQ